MTDGEELQRYLAERDVPCPGCGYNLRGLTHGACPECNQPIALGVRLVEPKLGAFLFGVISIGMALGFCTLVVTWGIVMGAPSRDLAPLGFGVPIGAGLLWLWIANRRSVQKMRNATRWQTATLLAALAYVCPLWFMFTVR